jgi:hypothetical protein
VSFRLELRPQVTADVFAAAAWYEERAAGLGAEFAFAVQRRFDELLQNPLLPRIRDRIRGVRWVLCEWVGAYDPERFDLEAINRRLQPTKKTEAR